MPNDTQPLGTLTRDGDDCTMTFTRDLAHPRDKVWRAITESEHLAAWFPDQIVGERRPGAPLRFVPHGHDERDGFDGEMLAFEPPSRMELLWGTDRLRIALEARGDGTRLTLAHTFTELGKAARDAAGWHECLDRLLASLQGDALPEWGVNWRAVHQSYVAVLGDEASTIGPPPGWE